MVTLICEVPSLVVTTCAKVVTLICEVPSLVVTTCAGVQRMMP